ncbi:hypothetical protein ERJ75_001624500 [Trypanosoma vivax]|nr:hypothetical protein ERJ75_001624500 [Trypanosoma vivax]
MNSESICDDGLCIFLSLQQSKSALTWHMSLCQMNVSWICKHDRLPLGRRCAALQVPAILSTNALFPTLCLSKRPFIEHSTSPDRWRSPEKTEVNRRHTGVRLGSEFARIKEQAELEQKLVDADRFTDWNMVFHVTAGVAIVLVLLNVLLETVEPNPSPEYTPYVSVSEKDQSIGGG